MSTTKTLLVRRSNLLLPVTDAAQAAEAWRHDADAVTLDLEDGVAADRKAEARTLVRNAIAVEIGRAHV
jgi:citrate lyase beta subunit